MSRYMNVKVNVSEGQKDKIKRALEAGTGVTIRLSHGDLSGEHVLALTQGEINKMAKVYQNGTGMALKMSKTQLEHNAKVEGGFIGAILPFLATAGKFLLSSVLPSCRFTKWDLLNLSSKDTKEPNRHQFIGYLRKSRTDRLGY